MQAGVNDCFSAEACRTCSCAIATSSRLAIKETVIEAAQSNIRAAATLIPRIQLTPCLRGRRPAGNSVILSGRISQRLSRPQYG